MSRDCVLLDDGNDRYVWGPNGLAYQVGIARPQPYVMHADGQGSIRAITEGSPGPNQPAMVLRTFAFDEFGAPIAAQTTSAGTAPLNPFGYTGEQTDPALGLINLRARMYDSGLGRFLQRDRVWGSKDRPQTLDRFAYVENNPANRVDPTGRKSTVLSLPCSWAQTVGETPVILMIGECLPTIVCGGFGCTLDWTCNANAKHDPEIVQDCDLIPDCFRACGEALAECRADAKRRKIPDFDNTRFGCSEGYGHCLRTGGCFLNPGWRGGDWVQVWKGRPISCHE